MRSRGTRRAGHIFLCAAPFLAVMAVAPRGLRDTAWRQPLGAILFAAIALSVWVLAGDAIRSDTPDRRQCAFGGAFLVAPFALMALLWVGLGTPWEATARDNQMRYLVLIVMAVAEVAGFLMVRAAMRDAGERVFSTLVIAAVVLAGPLYLVWDAYMFGVSSARAHSGQTPAALEALNPMMDLLLDLAAMLTYVAAASLAAALGRLGWIGRWAARAFVCVNAVALILLVNRGLTYLSPAQLGAPWYTVPGFIVGIPAVPYVMPLLLGVAVLRRAGGEPLASSGAGRA